MAFLKVTGNGFISKMLIYQQGFLLEEGTGPTRALPGSLRPDPQI